MSELPPVTIDAKTFFREHHTLPALPQVVTRVQQVIRDETLGISGVVDLIGSDPGLVAQILKVVNSAYYGLPREVGKVQFAIAFLGLNEVYRIVLALSVINTLSIKQKNALNTFWHHSFYTALATKLLAKKYEPQLSFDELWSAAILHDIGKLVYLKFFPDHYKALKQHCESEGCLFSEAESALKLPTSSYMGTLLCDHWSLPNSIREVCSCHTLGDLQNLGGQSSSVSFKRMVCLGNLTAILAADELFEEKKHEITAAIRSSLNCSEASFLDLMGEIYMLRIDVEEFTKRFQ